MKAARNISRSIVFLRLTVFSLVIAFAPICAPEARVKPSQMLPLVSPDFKPVDDDERGLWLEVGRIEAELSQTEAIVRDPELNNYVRGVLDRVLGEYAPNVRLLIIRDPSFNAFMYPNGLMAIHTGLLLRLRNEAQLAATLGHEAGHYLRRHQLQGHRRFKTISAVQAFTSLGVAIAGARTGVDVSRDIQDLQFRLAALYFAYQRGDEEESDAFGLKLLEANGYAPAEASGVWDSVILEEKNSAKARGRRFRGNVLSYTDTHPTSASRSKNLKLSAGEVTRSGVDYRVGDDSYRSALAKHLPGFLEEQVKLNDPGAALYLIGEIKKAGSSGFLEFQEAEVLRQRGNPGDELLALAGYQKAVLFEDVPAEAFRGLGNSLLRLGRQRESVAPLKEYMRRSPDAADREYVEATLHQLEGAP